MANNVFQVKRTNVSGRTPNTTGSYGTNSQYIAAGEFALNMADSILYTSNGSAVITVGSNLINQNITGNLTVKAIIANGSIGVAGQTLTSNGSAVYWATGTGSGTVTQVNTGNGMTGGPITSTGTVSILANTGIVANATGTYVNATYIGTLTANNTSFVGSISAANVVSNAQLSGNLANYVTTTNLTNNLANYQTTAGLATNVATLTANNANNLNGQPASYYTNATNITTGTLPYSQIPANIVNTTANFTISGNLYFTGTNNFFNSLTQFNSGIWRSTASGPSYWLQQDGTGRVHWYWGTAGGTSPTFATSGEDASALTLHVSNAGAGGRFFHRSASGVGKLAGDALTWTTTLYTDLNTLSWKGTAIAVSNGSTYNLTANNASFLGGTAAASYQLNSTLAANVATLTANNSTNLNGQAASFYTNATNITTGKLPVAQINTSSVYNWTNTHSFSVAGNQLLLHPTGNTVTAIHRNNGSSYYILLSGNNASPNNTWTASRPFTVNLVTGAVTMSNGVNVGSSLYPTTNNVALGASTLRWSISANTIDGTGNWTTTGSVNASSFTVGSNFIANSTQVTFAVPFSANGGTGTAGHVLTSNGATGSPYWAAAAGGGYYKGGSAAVGSLAVGGQNLFRVNANTLNFNTTIAAGENAQATGPIAVASGITLTVESGARVAIV